MGRRRGAPRHTSAKGRRAARGWVKGSTSAAEPQDVGGVVSMRPRLRYKTGALRSGDLLRGRVVTTTGRAIHVAVPSDADFDILSPELLRSPHTIYECRTTRSTESENESSTLIAVGDVVQIDRQADADLHTVALVEARQNGVSRAAAGTDGIEHVIAANIDLLVVVNSIVDPYYNRRLIDRYLVACEFGDIPALVVLTKTDLLPFSEIADDFDVYDALGVEVVPCCVRSGEGIDTLRDILAGRTSAFSGPSGVGKSSLLNAIFGTELQRTAEVSDRTGKGMHCTTSGAMFALPNGGIAIDTPGIREYALWGIPKADLALLMPDIAEFAQDCRFLPCSHTHEPHCAVKQAVEDGEIDPQRYESYILMLESLEEEK